MKHLSASIHIHNLRKVRTKTKEEKEKTNLKTFVAGEGKTTTKTFPNKSHPKH